MLVVVRLKCRRCWFVIEEGNGWSYEMGRVNCTNLSRELDKYVV